MNINKKGLGLKQLKLLFRMKKEDLVIAVINDDSDMSRVIQLQDKTADNIYEAVPHRVLESLLKRGFFISSVYTPCLTITIQKFFLKENAI